MTEIVNRVAKSGLVTFDLESFYPESPIKELDIKPWLFQGLILKEKPFRTSLKEFDWLSMQDCLVHVYSSSDAIIPQWAFMLIASYLDQVSTLYCFGSKDDILLKHFQSSFNNHSFEQYQGAKVVLKGCGKHNVPNGVYMEAASRLLPVVSSLMFGEPCSTVPIYKKKK